MAFENYSTGNDTGRGYLALPPEGRGPGLLLLHAWWGLTDFFTGVADKLAAEGFVVFAPDLFDGATTDQIAEAEKLVTAAEENFEAVKAKAQAGLDYLVSRPEVSAGKPAVVGFSFGAAYAYFLDKGLPEAFGKVVLFYGMAGVDVSQSSARYLTHFAENDPFESTEEAQAMQAENLERHIYPGTGHWFFEDNRPDAYDAAAAELAWARTLAFLKA